LAAVAVLPVVLPPPCCHGMTQLDWQFAACELQSIMQLVTVELWARRIFPADAAPLDPATAAVNTAHKIASRRIAVSSALLARGAS
jgi:hypothetical protein